MMQQKLKETLEIDIIPPCHNAWVVADEPCIMIDFKGVKDYAKKNDQ
jgi:hypothetical protein